jgi:adenylyl-sulfate kinase
MQNLTQQILTVSKHERLKLKGHNSLVIWFTGLSGSGKSTIANQLESLLNQKGLHTYLLDGDNIRMGLNKDLTFSQEDRTENLRRVAEVAKLMADSGIITIAAFITPMEADRALVKAIIGEDNFCDIFVDTSLTECIKRDVKGLYKKALAGEITNFTGVSAPFETPLQSVIHITTEKTTPMDAAQTIYEAIRHNLTL